VGSGEEGGVDGGDNGDGRSFSCVGEEVLSSVGVGGASCRAGSVRSDTVGTWWAARLVVVG
jgi:hypothetical protein